MTDRTNITISAAIGGVVGALLGGYSPRITPFFGAALGASVSGATVYFMEKKKEETAALNGNGNGGGFIGPPQCGEGFVHDGGIPGTCIPVSEAAALGLPTGEGPIIGGMEDFTPIVDPIINNPAFANVSVEAIDPSLMVLGLAQ